MVTAQEFNRFVDFARIRVERGEAKSLTQLLQAWQQQADDAQSIESIRQGLAEARAGKGQPVSEAFAEIRSQMGIEQ